MASAVSGFWITAFVVFSLSFGVPFPSAGDTGNAPVFTNAAQVLRLTADEAKSKLPVRIRGIVTCYDPGNVLFVQDATAGIFVHCVGDRPRVRSGQPVEVTGYAGKGLYSPIVISTAVVAQESGPAISPRPVTLAQIYHGGLDAQWVEVIGVVRCESITGQHLAFELVDSPLRIPVWFVDGRGYDRDRLAGSEIRLRGIACTQVNAQGQLQGFQICANSVSDVTVIQAAADVDPFAAARFQVRDLQRYGARSVDSVAAIIRGVVTLCLPERAIFVQDATGGVEVRIHTTPENLKPGDTVEVSGYPGPIQEPPVLEDACIREVEPPMILTPANVSPAALFQSQHDNQLVQIEGSYAGRVTIGANVVKLAIQAGDHQITAVLDTPDFPGALSDLKPGSLLRLTGVCRSERTRNDVSSVFLFLRSPADVVVLRAPSSSQGTELALATGAAVLGGVGVVVALWFMRNQRRRAEHVLELHASLQAEMRQSEQQLQRSVDERERIGRDLHDDIIQSIYAAGLSLEDSRRVLRKSPDQAEARLGAAIHTLNDTIRGVRGFIAGLEPKVLNGRELKTALKSLALTSGDAPTPFQFQVEPEAANSLTSTEATQLLHIAKEGMSNSSRHAHASRVIVSIKVTGQGVQLEIADDGVGFAPEAAPIGQGLRNMATRAREIGGTLRTVSSPGQGCRIIVVVPQRNSTSHD